MAVFTRPDASMLGIDIVHCRPWAPIHQYGQRRFIELEISNKDDFKLTIERKELSAEKVDKRGATIKKYKYALLFGLEIETYK